MKAIFVGPMKTGTSWIHAYLEARGDVSIPSLRKETFFFDRYYHRGESWYLSQFTGNVCQGVEVAPSYFASKLAISRIKSDMEDVRIIITLRNPVRRLVSHFHHRQRYGQVGNDLQQAVLSYPEIREHSLYRMWVNHWEEEFNGHVDILCYETLVEAPALFVGELNKVLGLSGYGNANLEQLFSSFVNPKTAPRNRAIARLAKLSSSFLYDVGADSVVRLLKRTGLRKTLFEGGKIQALPTTLVEELEAEFREEIRFHEKTCLRQRHISK